ncbi:MAG TPA: hypothetical protein VKB50_01750 [Vicinamibacterales bacterium]|nr:hypothetical protein [Vicinamibacterales bacterium]
MSHRMLLTSAAFVLGCAITLVAQDKPKTLTAIGPVSKIAGDILTVDTDKGTMEFSTTNATVVKVQGGSSKTRAAKEAGAAGLKITDAVHVGDQVSVKYTDTAGKKVASEIDVKVKRPASAQPPK